MLNILLITADQWRGDCLGALGHPCVRTPGLDALAREAVLFARHYAGAAPCSPARACLYTGLYQMNNRVCRNGTPLDARHDTLALALRRLGYEPTLFGYTDTSPDPRGRDPKDPALRTYEGLLPGFTARLQLAEDSAPWLSWLASQGVDVPEDGLDIDRPLGVAVDPPTTAPPAYSRDQTRTAFLTDAFLGWLSEQPRGRPWCAHVSFVSPHPPFVVPEPYNRLIAPEDVPAPFDAGDWREIAARHPFLEHAFATQRKASFLRGAEGFTRDWTNADVRTLRAIYYGMIAEVDAQIARMIEALKQTGAWKDTLIVFTSDHGEMLGDHRLFGKLGFHDQSYHVPLIMRDPTRPEAHGRRVDRFTEAVDVMPTLLAALGETPAPHLDGASLLPFLEDREPEHWRDAAHWEFDFRDISDQSAETHYGLASRACTLAVLRDERFKYVHFAGLPPLLFDLAKDPGETTDVSCDPDYASARIDCAERMLSWRARHLDQSLAFTELTADGPVSLAPEQDA